MSSMKIAHFVPIGQQAWPPHAILVSDWSISKTSSPLKPLSHMNRNLVGSIYMYGRFCIKFPQSRMKGERHRLSPLSLQFCVTIDVTKKEIKDNKRYSSVATTVALVCYFVDIVACCLSCELVIVGLKQVKNISVISCQEQVTFR